MDVGVVLQTNPPASRVVDLARQAENLGFSHVWTFDSHLLWEEPFVIYSQILAATRKVMVGPMVTNPATRDWTVTASLFATLNEMFGNRTICGIGRGDSAVRVLNGKPATLATLRECIEVVRELANGRSAEVGGTTLRFPWGADSRLDIWVAAYGPKALALTGEVGDGFILQLADPDIAAWTIRAVRQAAEKAGRDPAAVRFCVAAPAYVGDADPLSLAHQRDQCRWFGGMVGNHVADLVARYGSDGAVPEALTTYIAGRTGYDYNEHGRAGNSHTEFVPDEIVDRFCLLGPPAAHVERLERLAELGVDQFAVYLQHDNKLATLEAYGETVIPAVAHPFRAVAGSSVVPAADPPARATPVGPDSASAVSASAVSASGVRASGPAGSGPMTDAALTTAASTGIAPPRAGEPGDGRPSDGPGGPAPTPDGAQRSTTTRGRAARAARVRRAALAVLAVLLLCALWEVYKAVGSPHGTRVLGVPVLPRTTDAAMPHTWSVLAELGRPELKLSGNRTVGESVLSAMWFSLRVALVGFAVGVVVGLLLAVAMARLRVVERGLLPYVVASQTVPLVALAPLVAGWGGRLHLGGLEWQRWMSVSLIAAYLAFFPVAMGMLRGLQSPAADSVELLRSYAASWWQTLVRLRLPASVPYLVPALKLAAAAAVVGTIVAEISTGTRGGIGRLIIDYSISASTDASRLYAAVLGAAATGLVMAALVAVLELALTRRRGDHA